MAPIQVTSSAIEEYEYEPYLQELTIKWVNGGTYVYKGVPINKVHGFEGANSKGAYFNKEIRPYHDGVRIKG